MRFLVGDKILFKNSNLKGIVIEVISDYKVIVCSEEGLNLRTSVRELIKVNDSTNNSSAYGSIASKKMQNIRVNNFKKKSKEKSQKVDLHIQFLKKEFNNLSDFEILQIQIDECYSLIENAFKKNMDCLEIIHGIGKGTLRKKVHEILKSYQLRYYLSNDAGSTIVYF